MSTQRAIARVCMRRAAVEQQLSGLRARTDAARNHFEAINPLLLLGAALATGALLGRALGGRLLAPAALAAGLVEEQAIKVLFGALGRLWNAYSPTGEPPAEPNGPRRPADRAD